MRRILIAALLLMFAAVFGIAPVAVAQQSPGTQQNPGTQRSPGQERILVIGTKQAPPFAIKAEDGTWSGISIELWRQIANRLHLRYRFQETDLDGLIDGTANGSLDGAVAAISVTNQRGRVVDFTQPFFSAGLGIAVPHAAKFDWLRLLDILISVQFLEAVVAIIAVTIVVGVIVWLIERRHSAHFCGLKKGLVSSVWWSAMTVAQAGPEQEPETLWGRLVAVTWMTASVMAVAVFTAGITSQITAQQLRGSVHGLADLRSARVGVVDGTATLDYLTRRHIRFRKYASVPEGLEALRKGQLDAFVHDRPLLAYYAKQDFAGTVDLLDTTFDRQSYAIALPEASPLRMPINLVLLDLIRSPWWDDLNTKYLGEN